MVVLKLKVQDLMIRNVVTASKETTINDAVKILFEKHVGALVITNDEGKIKGIFTERDALRSIAGKIPSNIQILKVMSKNVVTVDEDSSFAKAKSLMLSHSIRHLPVKNGKGHLVGMLTLRRILDELVGMSTVKS